MLMWPKSVGTVDVREVREMYRARKRIHHRTICVIEGWLRNRQLVQAAFDARLAEDASLREAVERWEKNAPDVLTDAKAYQRWRDFGVQTPGGDALMDEVLRARDEHQRKLFEEISRRIDDGFAGRHRGDGLDGLFIDWQAWRDDYARRYDLPVERACFAVLGVAPGASLSDVKAAYRRKAVEHHPDKGGDAAFMARINGAYEEAVRLACGR